MDLLPNLSIHTLDYARYPKENGRKAMKTWKKQFWKMKQMKLLLQYCPAYMPMQGFASPRWGRNVKHTNIVKKHINCHRKSRNLF